MIELSEMELSEKVDQIGADIHEALIMSFNDGYNRALQEMSKSDNHLEYRLPEMLTKALKENSMKNVNISQATGISQSALHHYIHGTRIPSAKNLYLIAEALGVTADYLLTGGIS